MKTKENKGITLVSLVITIILLLILAGITISSITSTGVFEKTKEAREETIASQDIEKIQIAIINNQINDYGMLELKYDSFKDEINKQFDNKAVVFNNGEGIYTIRLDDRIYETNKEGNIEEIKDTIKISTVSDLKKFRDSVNQGNTYKGYYIYLTNDITLDSSENWEPIGFYSMDNSNPKSDNNKPFMGIFDGMDESNQLSLF